MSRFVLHREGRGAYKLEGELTFATAAEVLQRTARLFQEGGRLTFDLRNLERADSAGVALLIEWMRLARKNRVRLCLEHLPDQLENLMRVSGVDALLPSSPGLGQKTAD